MISTSSTQDCIVIAVFDDAVPGFMISRNAELNIGSLRKPDKIAADQIHAKFRGVLSRFGCQDRNRFFCLPDARAAMSIRNTSPILAFVISSAP